MSNYTIGYIVSFCLISQGLCATDHSSVHANPSNYTTSTPAPSYSLQLLHPFTEKNTSKHPSNGYPESTTYSTQKQPEYVQVSDTSPKSSCKSRLLDGSLSSLFEIGLVLVTAKIGVVAFEKLHSYYNRSIEPQDRVINRLKEDYDGHRNLNNEDINHILDLFLKKQLKPTQKASVANTIFREITARPYGIYDLQPDWRTLIEHLKAAIRESAEITTESPAAREFSPSSIILVTSAPPINPELLGNESRQQKNRRKNNRQN